MALRGGARGLSLAGLNIIVDGKLVPLAQLQEMVEGVARRRRERRRAGRTAQRQVGPVGARQLQLRREGRDRDAARASMPISGRWSAASTTASPTRRSSACRSRTASRASSSIRATKARSTPSRGLLSLYGSAYAAKNFYFDAIVNVAERRATTPSATSPTSTASGWSTADASGDTDGMTLSGGLSGGYDFLVGGLTMSPNLGFFYIDATIDGFTETGAGGLNLIYDEQKFKSLTGNVGLRRTYAWNLPWGVLLPHLRADYVREFEDDVDVFGVRFAAIRTRRARRRSWSRPTIRTQSYWRLAGGLLGAVQVRHLGLHRVSAPGELRVHQLPGRQRRVALPAQLLNGARRIEA